MKVGVFTDVHGNLPALSAMLKKFAEADCERIICCGDILGIGPYPEETVQALQKIPGLLAVRGNHDRYLTDGLPAQVPNTAHMCAEEIRHHKRAHSVLSQSSRTFLASLPNRMEIVLAGVRLCILHYAMDPKERYLPIVAEPNLYDCQRLFSEVEADVVLYGHDHRPFVCQDEKKLYGNCGSLGCPAGERNVARGGILTLADGRAEFAPCSLRYAVRPVIDAMERLDDPAEPQIKRIFFGIKEKV